MTRKHSDPKYLDDVIFGHGLPADKAYGASHAPQFAPEKEAEIFAAARAAIDDLMGRLDGFHVLAAFAAMQSASALAPPPQRVGTMMVELAQAEVLRRSLGGTAPSAAEVAALVDALEARQHLFLAQTSKPGSDAKRHVLQRRMVQTLLVRHTNYPHHQTRINRRIGSQLGEFGKTALGMPFETAMMLAEGAAVSVVSQLKTSGTAKALATWTAGGDAAFDPAWLNAFRVDLVVMEAALKLPRQDIEQLLKILSIAPGELADRNPDHLPLDNPVWRRPFLRSGDDFYLFSPETIFSSSFDIMAEIADACSSSGTQALGDARGPALEALLGETLAKLLPSAEIYTGAHWYDPHDAKARETDAIAIVDGIVFIFEAKGDMLNATARRGSEAWFKAFDDIAVGAAFQGWRLETVLRDRTEATLKISAVEGERVIDKADVRHIVRFGISLERVTTMSFGLDTILDERIRRTGASPMPVFTIGDLWQVQDLLPSEGHRLHFLLRRAELEEDGEFIGDELDLLALYLRTGFVRVGNGPAGEGGFGVYGLSDFLRHFQKKSSHHNPRAKIPRRTTSLWDRLIADKVRRRPPLWTDVVYDLLNIPYESQRHFERNINTQRRRVRRAGKRATDGAVMQAPRQLRPSHFVCVVTGRMSERERILHARSVFNAYVQACPDERLLVLVLDTGSAATVPALPYYRALAWHRRPVVEFMEGKGVESGLSFSVASGASES